MSGLMIRPSAVTILGASGVAVSCPADTTEDILATITVPAGAMGLNGIIRVDSFWSFTNSAGTKAMRVRLGGIGGTAHMVVTLLTIQVFASLYGRISNRGAANSQVGFGGGLSGANTVIGPNNGIVTGAIDTSAATTVVITGQKNTGGDTLTLESYLVELILP